MSLMYFKYILGISQVYLGLFQVYISILGISLVLFQAFSNIFKKYQPSGKGVDSLTACNAAPPAKSKMADGVWKVVYP